jgi:hypothetical protein
MTRRGTPARWASPTARLWLWRAWVRPASSRARKHLQKSVLGSKAGSQQFETRHRGGSPQTRRGVVRFPVHRAARLSHEHRQKMVGAARPWRWGARSPRPRPPYRTEQLGATAKAPDTRRDARSVQSTTARRGEALGPSSKTTRNPALTSAPGRRGLG